MNEDQDTKTNTNVSPETSTSAEEDVVVAPTEIIPTKPVSKRPIKLIIAALIAATVVVLIGGSVFGYTMWYQNPDKVVHDAVLNAIKADTVSSSGTITYTSDDIKIDISLDGKSAQGNGEFTIIAKGTINAGTMKQDFNATGTGRIVNNTLYIKLSGIHEVVDDTAKQSGGQIPEYAANIFKKIEDRWISIQPSDYQEVNKEIAAQQVCFMNLLDTIESNSSMSNEVASLYRNHQVLIIKEELGSKDINGVTSLGYKVASDKDAANAFVKGLEETSFGKELKKCNEDINFEKIAEELNHGVADDSIAPVTELWVSQFGHDITQISVYGNSVGSGALNVTLQPTFNESVTIEVPKDAVSLRSVLGEIRQTITEYYSGMNSATTLPSGIDTSSTSTLLQPAV